MRIVSLALLLAIGLSAPLMAAGKQKTPTWTDPAKAAEEHPDFLIQGEYAGEAGGKKIGLQAADMDKGKFLVSVYQGGLPGDGWDTSKIDSQVMERDALKKKLEGLKRVERVSKTMGKKPPEGALVIFAGEKTDLVKGTIKDGLLWPPAQTTKDVGSFEMHLEFRLPFKPGRLPSNQDRGNSGVYIFNNYECQVLDSFALDLNKENCPFKPESDSKQWCGCLYKFKLADLNMAYPPLRWQTYDIEFTAPVFEGGKKVKNARITAYLNGVKIHNDVELPKGTGAGGGRPEKPKSTIIFQGHGNPVAYRNIWLKERK